MKSIKSKGLDFREKKILIRLDLNVPLDENNIVDSHRIDKIIPTLNYLLNKNAKLIILSHIGRPKGEIIKDVD